MKRMTVALVFLTMLVALAAPALAGSGDVPERQAPGWQLLSPNIKPSGRNDHAMAYDTTRGLALVFGGYDDFGNYLDDTWQFDSTTLEWSEIQTAHRPSPRAGHAMVFDEAHGVIVLFGGDGPGVGDYSDETWIYDPAVNDWIKRFPADKPSARERMSMAYNSDRQVVTLFGGGRAVTQYGDLWEWQDGANWVEQPAVGPTERSSAAMAYDRRRSVMVLFAGFNSTQGAFNDVWELRDSSWEEVTPVQGPEPRQGAGIAYLPQARRVFIYGGSYFSFYDDTILWNGQVWATRPFNPRPAGRAGMGLVYDPVLKGLLLFGGSVSTDQSDETWLFK